LNVPEELNLDFDKIRKEIKNMDQVTEYDIPQMSAFSDFVYGSLRFSEAASGNLSRATKGNAAKVVENIAKWWSPEQFKGKIPKVGSKLSVKAQTIFESVNQLNFKAEGFRQTGGQHVHDEISGRRREGAATEGCGVGGAACRG
jgi:IS30 family transposase